VIDKVPRSYIGARRSAQPLDAVRAVVIFSALSLVGIDSALACSCDGIGSIEDSMARAEAVVLAQVKGRALEDSFLSPMDGSPVVVEVVKALKGDVSGELYVTTLMMCSRSFDLEDLEVGQTYVLPMFRFDRTARDAIAERYKPIGKGGSTVDLARLFVLPSCAHSALALSEGKLYSNDQTAGGRRLNFHSSLSSLESKLQPRNTQALGVVGLGVGAGAVVLVVLLALWLRSRSSTSNKSLERTREG
jgi:hypothetical protein